mgnify:CR=1 FL=1
MDTYVTLVKFTSEGLKSIADFGKEWEEGVKRTARWESRQLALMVSWDPTI